MAERNPPWSRDELILALNLYMAHRPGLPPKGGIEVTELSALLNRLHRAAAGNHRADLRNPNGCYLKLTNFRRFDPDYTADGKTGMQRGNKEEGPVWSDFAGDLGHLQATATAIRAAIVAENNEATLAQAAEGDDLVDVEAPEGRVLTRLHRFRERNRKLVADRKTLAAKQGNGLICEACGFDFAIHYGARGVGFIECHHTRPLHTLRPGEKTRLLDLALVCANCHRMIHAGRPWLTMEELRAIRRTQD